MISLSKLQERIMPNRLRTTFCLFIAIVLMSAEAQAQTNAAPPETIVRGFYSWYLGELKKGRAEPLKQKTVALKYLTPQLYANAPRLTRRMDADIFICAQDWDEGWEKNFTIGSIATNGGTATTLVTLPSGQDKVKIKVTLRKISVGWRIDKVACAT
jgi:hypothetical protein